MKKRFKWSIFYQYSNNLEEIMIDQDEHDDLCNIMKKNGSFMKLKNGRIINIGKSTIKDVKQCGIDIEDCNTLSEPKPTITNRIEKFKILKKMWEEMKKEGILHNEFNTYEEYCIARKIPYLNE